MDTCFRKRILLLLIWYWLFSFSWCLLASIPITYNFVYYSSVFLSCSFAPFIGWLADVKFGRYKIIKFGSAASFLATIFYYFAMFTGRGDSTLSNVLLSMAFFIVSMADSCYEAAMLPFLTDQMIGATSDELSAVVRWYYWAQIFGFSLAKIIAFYCTVNTLTL